MKHKRRYFWIIGFLACMLLLLIAGLVFTVFRSGIHVTVQNTGSQPMSSVVLHVTGASHNLGDIAPGDTASATVHPTGESHLEIEFTDPDGWTDSQSGVKGSSPVRHLFEPTDEVSIRFYLKLSKGWGWSGRNYHPHLTHFLTTETSKWHGPAASHLTLYIEPVGGKLRLAAQDIQNKDMPHGLTQGPLKGGYNGKFYDSEEVLFDDDQWHCVEAYFKLNTLDLENDHPNRDGIVRGWFDGKLVVEYTDVVLRSTDFPKMKFNQFLMAPYFGPGLLPHAQKLWIDELAVGTKRKS